jgi:hypothetical protein
MLQRSFLCEPVILSAARAGSQTKVADMMDRQNVLAIQGIQSRGSHRIEEPPPRFLRESPANRMSGMERLLMDVDT